MKAIGLLLISFFVICVSTTTVVASNESDKAKIQRAMKAAPSSISAGATIRDADWTILRQGTPTLDEYGDHASDDDGNLLYGNGWTCFPGVPVTPGDKHPMCNDEVWMAWLDAVVIFFNGDPGAEPPIAPLTWTFSTDKVGYSYMLRGDALVNNNFVGGGDEGLWDQEGPHIMMLFPTAEEIADLPRDPNAGGPYVMWGDPDFFPYDALIHVMVPLTDRDR